MIILFLTKFNLLLFILVSIISIYNCELRFVFEMFRHGARAPWNSLNKTNIDIFGEKWSGDSELTGVGMRQHFLLGFRNRKKYSNFISEIYDPKEIYIMSTDTNRTLMSAYSQLQGFYPAGTGPKLNIMQQSIALPPVTDTDFNTILKFLKDDALPNQIGVFPIHVINKKSHTFYLHDPDVCPTVGRIMEENRKKSVSQQKLKEFKSTYGEIFKNALNLPNYDYFFHYLNIYVLCDTFHSNYFEQKELKMLIDAGLNLTQFNQFALDFLFYDMFYVEVGDDNDMIGLSSMSPTMLSLIQWMDKRIENDKNGKKDLESDPKFVMLSGHDSNLAALQIYLKVVFDLKEFKRLPFASNMFFELHKNKNGSKVTFNDYSVQINLNEYNLFNRSIPYDIFRSNIISKSLNSTQIQSFCGWNSNFSAMIVFSNHTLLIVLCFSFLCVGFLFFLAYKCSQNRKNNLARIDSYSTFASFSNRYYIK